MIAATTVNSKIVVLGVSQSCGIAVKIFGDLPTKRNFGGITFGDFTADDHIEYVIILWSKIWRVLYGQYQTKPPIHQI